MHRLQRRIAIAKRRDTGNQAKVDAPGFRKTFDQGSAELAAPQTGKGHRAACQNDLHGHLAIEQE
ncbi:hypothetical protein D3C80_1624350 [compost metagenome]